MRLYILFKVATILRHLSFCCVPCIIPLAARLLEKSIRSTTYLWVFRIFLRSYLNCLCGLILFKSPKQHFTKIRLSNGTHGRTDRHYECMSRIFFKRAQNLSRPVRWIYSRGYLKCVACYRCQFFFLCSMHLRPLVP